MSEPIVTIRNVSKRFGAKAALADVSADVQAGDIIGVLGKNGAGKTTLLEVLLGFSPSNEGSAAVFGEDCHALCRPRPRRRSASCRSKTSCSCDVERPAATRDYCGVSRELGSRARRPPRRRVERADRSAHLHAFGRRAPEALRVDSARPSAAVAGARRARGEPGSDRTPAVPETTVRHRGGSDSRGAVLVAHRLGSRARREQGLDHQGRPVALAGRDRRAQGVGRARCTSARVRRCQRDFPSPTRLPCASRAVQRPWRCRNGGPSCARLSRGSSMPPSKSSRSASKRSSWSCTDERRAARLLDVLHGVSTAAVARDRRRPDRGLGTSWEAFSSGDAVFLRARGHFLYRACGVSGSVRRRRNAASAVSAAKSSALAALPRAHVDCSGAVRDGARAVAGCPHRAADVRDRASPARGRARLFVRVRHGRLPLGVSVFGRLALRVLGPGVARSR